LLGNFAAGTAWIISRVLVGLALLCALTAITVGRAGGFRGRRPNGEMSGLALTGILADWGGSWECRRSWPPLGIAAEFADDSADTAVPAAAPQAARPTEVNTDGQLRNAGGGPSRAATRRGTGPGAAKPASEGTGVPRETRAALPIAHATTLRLPTACAASSSAHRSAMYDTAVRRGRRNGLARAASWTASRNR
jgi:hypothetical protein